MGHAAEHAANVRRHAAAAQRVLDAEQIVATPVVDVRTRFCTATGWHRYDDLTTLMRRALLSTDGVADDIFPGWVTTRTINRLVSMGLARWDGALPRLTHHGGALWIEIDEER